MSETPTRITIPPALGYPVLGVLVVFIAGWLYTFAGAEHFAPWWLLLAVPVLGFLGAALARTLWADVAYGVAQQRAAVWFAWVAAAGAGAWLTWAGLVTPGAALPLLVLGALPLWGWFAILCLRAPKAHARQVERREEGRQIVQERSWRTILDRSGSEDVVITEVREHRAGMVLTVEPDPDAAKFPTYDEFAGRAPSMATQAAMHYRRTSNTRLPKNCVRTEPGRDDAEFLVHITMRDVFGASTWYQPDEVPGDIADPVDLGEYEDAARLLLPLDANTKIVGATGAGKSNLVNNIIGRITGTMNALVWVAATDKLVPLVWPWLRAWLSGKTSRPILDYVAGQDIDSVLRLLRATYRLVCERNARLEDESKIRPTADLPVVFVILEEVSHLTDFPDTIRTHDGIDCTASDLLKMIAQADRSAGVRLFMLSQYGINAALGDRASELIRNITCRICLRTMESHDGFRTLPGLPSTVDTTSLANFTMYVQPNTEEARAFPAKAPELDGAEQVEPVAIGNTRWRPAGVEPEVAALLGLDYERRWASSRLPILAAPVARRGWEWPGEQVAPVPVPAAPVDEVDEGSPVAGGPNDGGDSVDTTMSPEDEDAFRRLLGGDEPEQRQGPAAAASVAVDRDEDTSGRAAPFEVPDFGAEMAEMEALAADIAANPFVPGRDQDATREAGPGRPVPDPLDRVVRWLDSVPVDEDAWVRTEELVFRIGWDRDAAALGRALAKFPGVRSDNLPRQFDPQQRKGYPVRMLREAATRYRFGSP